MKFGYKHFERGDEILYKSQLKRDDEGNPINNVGTVIKQYPHFVLVKTPYGYNATVNNVDLYMKYGMR